jgi:putative ABC transport system ATP-binding protein
MTALEVKNLVKEYRGDGYVVRVLNDLSFSADEGELIVLLGPSGSGKTTLLSCLGAMLSPTSGSIEIEGVNLTELTGASRDHYRRDRVGFVFQGFNLIPSLSARENVAIPLLVNKAIKRADAFARADAILERVGLADRAKHKPDQLSGGQQQRVAVARGLVTDPFLLIADEPTANLDHIQAEAVIRLLRELRDDGRVIIVSTHDGRLVPVADRVVHMAPGGVAVEPERVTVRYAPGEVIFRQGQHADLVYVLAEGDVEIYRDVGDGIEESLAIVTVGNYFGELGAMMGFPRSASARAVTEVVAEAMGANEFRQGVEHAKY